jgi:hypothetical protein
MNCRRDVLGGWVYACEGTKAFARSFPLFAASMAMIVTGRYILQFRVYYHFLLKEALLDFTNHDFKRDVVMLLVVIFFCISVSHFALDFFFPPFLTLDKMTEIATVYFMPCAVFFMLMKEASDVEWRLMPLPKFVEEDPGWATQHIARSKKYLDTSIKHNSYVAEKKLYFEKEDHKFTLDELLDEIIRISKPVEAKFHDEPDHGDVKHGVHGIHKGFWPARILLNPYLRDATSANFKKAYMVYTAVFIVIQCALVGVLATSAVQEGIDAMPGGVPATALHAGGEAFQRMGQPGYCRDEGHHRPPGYFVSIDKLQSTSVGGKSALLVRSMLRRAKMLHAQPEASASPGTQSCALHCAGNGVCIGFAMDLDLCNIYLEESSPTPDGWDSFRSREEWSSSDNSRHTKWAIVTTDQSVGAGCFVKLSQEAEPENFVACFVYAVHILVILWLVFTSQYRTFKRHFVPVSRN